MFFNVGTIGRLRGTLLLGAASIAATSLSAAAFAQESSGTVETVVVTGSRIPQQGLYSSSPVTAVGQQEMKFEGTTDVANLINNLPEAFADQTSTMSNAATGTANIDLRGLGASRTLVLVDGTRLMPGDPKQPFADVNQIPAALVERVDVLTGGASAVYGSDAEAGVVNFIMRKDFQGIEVDGQYSVANADNSNAGYRALVAPDIGGLDFGYAKEGVWDGATGTATLILGTNTDNDKGNVTAYIGYQNTQPILENARDFSACSISTTSANTHVCSGSSNFNRWYSIDNSAFGQPSSLVDNFETGNGKAGSGAFVPYTDAANQHFNYGGLNYLQRPDTRYTGGFFARYEVNKQLDIYSSFMFTDDHTIAQIAPSGIFLGSGTVSGFGQEVNCGNPLMTAQENKILCGELAGDSPITVTGANGQPFTYYGGQGNIFPGQSFLEVGRRDIEGGNRLNDLRHTAYRMQIGAKGDLGDGWSYDVYAQYGLSLFTETYQNEFSKSRVQNALEVDPTTGQCISGASGCVPLDVFNGFGSITPAMLNYVKAEGFQEGYTQEQVISGSINGDLGKWGGQSPWAKRPISVALGTEYRSEALELQTDYEFQSNDLYGQGGATLPVPLSSFNVKELFGELEVPLVEGMPWVEDLSLNGAYRYSSYSTAGQVQSYKYGAEYQPIDDFRVRASFQRAVRAPNVLELFLPANVVLFGGTDPCASPTSAVVVQNCTHNAYAPADVPNTGNAGALSCPAAQCNENSGGNQHLKPETSDTRTAGIVFTPTFFDGFTATVDYFDIKITNFLSSIDPNVTLAACYGPESTKASQLAICPEVNRNNFFHAIWGAGYVNATTVNEGSFGTKGFDFEANYQTSLDDWDMTKGLGSVQINFIGTLLNSLTTTPIDGYLSYNCAGMFGVTCGSPSPRWRHKVRMTWESPWDFDLSVQWRHLAGTSLDINSSYALLNASCGNSGAPCPDLADARIASMDYIDLAGDWTIREGVELHAGVNNVFDRLPPVLDSNTYGIAGPTQFGNGNTYPGTYDSLGRVVFVGATIKY
jgi:outer membrane receptor protein involved in Fe transport